MLFGPLLQRRRPVVLSAPFLQRRRPAANHPLRRMHVSCGTMGMLILSILHPIGLAHIGIPALARNTPKQSKAKKRLETTGIALEAYSKFPAKLVHQTYLVFHRMHVPVLEVLCEVKGASGGEGRSRLALSCLFRATSHPGPANLLAHAATAGGNFSERTCL